MAISEFVSQILKHNQNLSPIAFIALLTIIGGLTGCARTKPLYDWGKYEDSLYLRYMDKDFSKAESYVSESLSTTTQPNKVPPGVYADYAFLLFRRGNYAGAIEYFEKEKKSFPESSVLMTKLIEKVNQKTVNQVKPELKDKAGTGVVIQ
jgi:hypothetical protein